MLTPWLCKSWYWIINRAVMAASFDKHVSGEKEARKKTKGDYWPFRSTPRPPGGGGGSGNKQRTESLGVLGWTGRADSVSDRSGIPMSLKSQHPPAMPIKGQCQPLMGNNGQIHTHKNNEHIVKTRRQFTVCHNPGWKVRPREIYSST